ncbi:uncharacterized protein VTP21DRAFT_6150 [Calcarisporiella thermophila]|uniref:uncharacterized protein n=1 Tax=Calcarisporiella thermophila TaxID=911321 RepID=UPI003742C2A7
MTINEVTLQDKKSKASQVLTNIVGGIKPREVEDIYPATPLQTSFITALAHDPQSHLMQTVYEIEGDFDISRLKSAWHKVAAANTILRTAFNEEDVHELQENYLISDRRRGFRVDATAFIRLGVVHIKGKNRYRLFWTIHHSVMDRVSFFVAISDTLQTYLSGSVKSRTPFKTHVESILSANFTEARDYWKAVFAGATVPEKLNFSDGNTELEGSGMLMQTYNLDVSMDAVRRYCNQTGLIQSNFLQAIWAIVLRHYTRSDDVIFGCVATDENASDSLRSIGVLGNIIPVRVVLKDSMTMSELALAMQNYHRASLPYSHVPLADIKRWTGLPWMQEMFPTLFDFQQIGAQQIAFESIGNGFKITKLDSYDSAIVGYDVISRMISKFNEVLGIVLNTSADSIPTLSDLDSLTSTDISFISKISHGKHTPLVYQCLHHGFEINAIKQPHAIAVEELTGVTITYGDLDARANALAHELRREGVAPGSRVGLVIKRSIEMLVGILAILKAGGAYVPIDAAFPRDRIEYILSDAGCDIVVTMRRAISSSIQKESRKIMLIDDYMQQLQGEVTKPEDLSTSDDTAFVVYTSGTTGKPKGVPIHHGGAMNCVQDLLSKNGSGPGVAQAQFMAVGFDGAVSEIFPCLTNGGKLILRSGEDVLESLKKVQSLMITPSGLQHINPESVPNLQVVILVGEPVPQVLAEHWLPHVKIFNGYGPTETSLGTSVQELKHGQRVGVGRPFNNVSYYVLDHNLKMVPLGVPGELYIGGPGVAKGYVNRPDLTEERFIDNPFSAGTKMYRTGDLVRWNSEGNLEIMGRIDDQVKLKGYRIELGEVASAMNAYVGVDAAVAVVKDNALIGFVTPDHVDVEALRDSLFEFLPEYMVPATIVALEKFPLTTNGKVDKAKLKEIPLQQADSQQLPATDKQKLVVNLMASVLNIDASTIDINTSFFALGGDSVSAIAFVTVLRRHGLHISIKQLYKTPTPARLVAEPTSNTADNSDIVVNHNPTINTNPVSGKSLRIVCLHGSNMSGKIMKLKMAPLEKTLGSAVNFIYIDACYESSSDFAQEVKRYYDSSVLSWTPAEPPQSKQVERAVFHILSILSFIGKVDGLLGFCEGSRIVELLDRLAQSGEIKRQWDFSVHISGVLLNPSPTFDLLPPKLANPDTCPTISIPSAHCMSPNDKFYPINLKIQGRYNPELSLTLEHDSGHSIPQTPGPVNALGSLILETAKKCQKF